MELKKLLKSSQSLVFFIVLAGMFGFFPAPALADCTYSGTLSWKGDCGATVNETVAEGASKEVRNTNLGFDGSITYTCQGGVFVKTGNDWCVAGAAPGSCGYSLQLSWSVFDEYAVSYQCSAMLNDPTFGNGQSRTVINSKSGFSGSATYTCNNGVLSSPSGMSCAPSGSGGDTTPPLPGSGGDTTPPPAPGSGGGTAPPSGGCSSSISSLSCNQYAGQFGIPVGYKSGTALVHYNSCTSTYTYLSGCSLGTSGSCVPDNSCAANFCTYEVCYDGCGGVIGGTKQCNQGLCTPDNSCTFTTPVGSTCINNCGQTVPGMQSSGGGSSGGGGGGGSTPPQNTGPGGNTTGNTGPILGSAVLFQNPLKFNDINSFVTSLLLFFQGFIVVITLIFIIVGAFLYITSAGNEGRMETGKKAILAAIVGLALGIAAPAFLREIGSILGWTTSNVPSGIGTSLSLLDIMTNVLSFLLTIIGIIAIIMLVIGGFLYLTAAGDEDRIDRGKKIVKYSIIGILIALAAMVLVKQIAGFFV